MVMLQAALVLVLFGLIAWLLEVLPTASPDTAVRIAQIFATLAGVFGAAITGTVLQDRQRQYERTSGVLHQMRTLHHCLHNAAASLEMLEEQANAESARIVRQTILSDIAAVRALDLGRLRDYATSAPVYFSRMALAEIDTMLAGVKADSEIVVDGKFFARIELHMIRTMRNHVASVIAALERDQPLPEWNGTAMMNFENE